MEFAELADVFEDLEGTSATNEKRDILAEVYRDVSSDLLPIVVKLSMGTVFEAWRSKELGVSTSLTKNAISQATGIDENRIESWWRDEGDLGSAAEKAVLEREQQTLFSSPLAVKQVHDSLQEIAEYSGDGSQGRRVEQLAGLISDANPKEARYLVRIVVGAMRLGVGEGIVRDAIAAAFLGSEPGAEAAVEEAYEVTNDFSTVATAARDGGLEELRTLEIEVFRPVKPMLAHKADTLEQTIEDLGGADTPVLFEAKYDGIRGKIHIKDDSYRLFTRRLEDVTEQFPDVISAVRDRISAETAILEAEIVGYDPDTGATLPFQELSRRIKRKYRISKMQEEIPVSIYLFDMLYHDGMSLLDEPLKARIEHLDSVLTPSEQVIERAWHIKTTSTAEAADFYESVLGEGHEGLMAKNLAATYQPGSRVGYQLKIKPTMEPLDLVVTRAKWSEGRKSEFLGRPYLACRDTETDELKEVGRMHTGFTDQELEEFHAEIEPLVQEVDGREAKVKPSVVLEVEYEEIQESPKYDSGYALRFPRFKGIRHDLSVAEIDTLDRVEQLYHQQET